MTTRYQELKLYELKTELAEIGNIDEAIKLLGCIIKDLNNKIKALEWISICEENPFKSFEALIEELHLINIFMEVTEKYRKKVKLLKEENKI